MEYQEDLLLKHLIAFYHILINDVTIVAIKVNSHHNIFAVFKLVRSSFC